MMYLPAGGGILPSWLALVAVISIGNSAQAYTSLYATRRVYSGPDSPVNPLSARTFGTWSLLSAIVRMYCAYHISNPVVYQLTLWTYVIAAVHFYSEWLWYGTAELGAGLVGPLALSAGSLMWMLAQWGYYVQ